LRVSALLLIRLVNIAHYDPESLAARESTIRRVPGAAGADARRRAAGDVVASSRRANTPDAWRFDRTAEKVTLRIDPAKS